MKKLLLLLLVLLSTLSAKNVLVDSTKFSPYLDINLVDLKNPGLVEVSPGISINDRLNIEYHFSSNFIQFWNTNYTPYSSHGIGSDVLLIKKRRIDLSANFRSDFGLHRWEFSSYDNIFLSNITEAGLNLYYKIKVNNQLRLIPGIGIHYGYKSQQVPPDILYFGPSNYSFWYMPIDLYLQIEKFYMHAVFKTWFNDSFLLTLGTLNLGVGFLI